MDNYNWFYKTWPIDSDSNSGDVDHRAAEDIRKMMWLVHDPHRGGSDLAARYGDSGGGYTLATLTAEMNAYSNSSKMRYAGYFKIYYTDDALDDLQLDNPDLFINIRGMSPDDVADHPPIDVVTGKVDSDYWEPMANPNLYHHFDKNSGRYWGSYKHADDNSIPGQTGTGGYHYVMEADKWLPRQTDPWEQYTPLIADLPARRHMFDVDDSIDGVERLPKHIAEYPLAQYRGNVVGSFIETDLLYTDWALLDGHPYTIKGEYFYEPKMDGGYQDWAEVVIESRARVNIREIATTSTTFIANYDLIRSIWTSDPIGYGRGESPWDPTALGVNAKYDPVMAYTYDYRWGCNGSSFEKALADISTTEEKKYDWYYDDKSGGNWNYWASKNKNVYVDDYSWVRGSELFPHPNGCWRRVWRHTNYWPTLSDGSPAPMWPGDAGSPPYYDCLKMMITQAQKDAIVSAAAEGDNSGCDISAGWTYFTNFYKVVEYASISQWFNANGTPNAAAISNYGSLTQATIDSLEWRHKAMVDDDCEHEMHPDWLNDIMEVLQQVEMQKGVAASYHKVRAEIAWEAGIEFDTALEAIEAQIVRDAAKLADHRLNDIESATNDFSTWVGWFGEVRYDLSGDYFKNSRSAARMSFSYDKSYKINRTANDMPTHISAGAARMAIMQSHPSFTPASPPEVNGVLPPAYDVSENDVAYVYVNLIWQGEYGWIGTFLPASDLSLPLTAPPNDDPYQSFDAWEPTEDDVLRWYRWCKMKFEANGIYLGVVIDYGAYGSSPTAGVFIFDETNAV